MKFQDLAKLSQSELNEKLAEHRKELFNLRFQHATAQLENTARIPTVKRIIARIETALRQKEIGA